jgi:hypothetical protein
LWRTRRRCLMTSQTLLGGRSEHRWLGRSRRDHTSHQLWELTVTRHSLDLPGIHPLQSLYITQLSLLVWRRSRVSRGSDCWLMAPEKSWCLVEWPARWEPQEEGVMNIAARFSLS